MTLEDWAFVSQIVGSLAVVPSLIYLALQVRHANVLSRAQARQSMMELTQEQAAELPMLPVMKEQLYLMFINNSIRRIRQIGRAHV